MEPGDFAENNPETKYILNNSGPNYQTIYAINNYACPKTEELYERQISLLQEEVQYLRALVAQLSRKTS